MAGLGELAEAIGDKLKDTAKPALPSATVSGIAWTAVRGAGGYVVGAYMGHPIVGALIGAFAPAPVVVLAIMGAYFNAARRDI
jgi:hypothetical protein